MADNALTTGDEPKVLPAIQQLRADLNRMASQFKFALPKHMPPERFVRVVMTAIQNESKLLRCERGSLFNACMKCAQDGLLPDGREAALVPYQKRGGPLIAQYLPMVAGIRKKVRQSGMLTDWNVQVVQQGDEFEYELGDNPFIRHKPAAKGGRARPVLFAYSIATYPDGTKSREVMNVDQINDVRENASKAEHGPLQNPIFYPEMARKTVAKLHAKQLPQSTDLDTLLRRDDALYDFAGQQDERRAHSQQKKPPPSVGAMLDAFADDVPVTEPAPVEPAPVEPDPPAEVSTPASESPAPTSPPPPDAIAAAYESGREAKKAGHTRKAVPGELRSTDRTAEAAAWLRGFDGTPI